MADSLLVKLGFNADKQSITGTVSGIGEITSALKRLKSAAEVASVGSGIKNISAGFAELASGVKDSFDRSFGFVERFSNMGDKIAKTSKLIGLSGKEYQALDFAARHAGLSTEEMDNAMRRFNVELGKARSGDAAATKKFDSILGGVSLKSFKDTNSILVAMADNYTKLGSAEQKAFVTQELFGRGGAKMATLLSDGGESLSQMFADFEKTGGGFNDEGLKNAEVFNDSLQDMTDTIDGLKISVAQELFPTFIDLFKSVQNFVAENRDKIFPVVREIFGKIGDAVKSLLPKIPVILDGILKAVNFIGPQSIVIGAAVVSILPAVGKILFGLYQILPALKLIIVGVKSVATWGWAIVNAFKITAAVIGGPTLAMIGLVVAAVVSWGIAIKSIYDNWNLVGDAVEWVWTEIKECLAWWKNGIYSLVIEPIVNFFKSLPGAFSDLWDGFKSGIANIGAMMYDAVFGSIRRAIDSVRSFVRGVPIIGSLFGDEDGSLTKTTSSASGSSSFSLGASVAQAVSESHTTTTSRFAVDFKNMPRGVQVTPPEQGDFDWSRGYVLRGV